MTFLENGNCLDDILDARNPVVLIHTISADGCYMPVGSRTIGNHVLDIIGGQDRLQSHMKRIKPSVGDCVMIQGGKNFDYHLTNIFAPDCLIHKDIVVALLVVSNGNELPFAEPKLYDVLQSCLNSFFEECTDLIFRLCMFDDAIILDVRCSITSLGCATLNGGLSWERMVEHIITPLIEKSSEIMKIRFFITTEDQEALPSPPPPPSNLYLGLYPNELWSIYNDLVVNKKPVDDVLNAIIAFKQFYRIVISTI